MQEHSNIPINMLPKSELLTILDSTLMVLTTDSEGIITYCNQLFAEVSGYTTTELIGKTYDILEPVCYQQSIKMECCTALQTTGRWYGEVCAISKSGGLFWTETNIVKNTNEAGDISGYVVVSSNITNHMLSAVKRDEPDDKYRNLFNYSPIPMWIYNRQTLQFMDVNQAAIRNYKYTRDEFLGMTIKEIRPAEDIPKLEILLTQIKESPNQNFKKIFRHTKKDGTIIHVNIQSNPIMFEGEQATLVLARDITEELDAKTALSLANMRLTTAQEIAKLGYWSNDLRKQVIHWSDEVYKIFELNKDTFHLTLDNIANQYHPEDSWRMQADLNVTFADKEIDEFDNRITTPTGKTKWIHQKIRLIRDNDNVPIAIEGVVQDVTESKEKEQHLEESNERFRLIMKASREALIDWDIVRDVTIWGDGFATIFGYDLSVYDNYLWSGNIHPEDRGQVLEDLKETLENPKKNVFYADFRFLKANREIAYVQHRGLIVRDKNGKPVRAVGSLLDMTEMVERNNKIEKQNKTFSEIAWIQSHKVRGPLTSIMATVNMLKMNQVADSSVAELLSFIDVSAHQLDKVIHEIVENSEKGIGK